MAFRWENFSGPSRNGHLVTEQTTACKMVSLKRFCREGTSMPLPRPTKRCRTTQGTTSKTIKFYFNIMFTAHLLVPFLRSFYPFSPALGL